MPQVLILGASSDIAVATAHKFGSSGYDLQLASREINILEPIKKDLEIRYEIQVNTYAFDATNFESHSAFYQSLEVKPEIVICVFGYLGDQTKAAQNWQECKRIIDTNYTGAVSILNIIANDFESKQKGTIVGISSVAGERGRQSNYLYGSAKAGFSTYLSGLRNRLTKSNVHVVTVKPGFVDTKMTEHLDLPKLLTAKPAQVAKEIYHAVRKRKNTLYVLSVWKIIMLIIKMIPEPVFKKMKL